MMTYKQFIQLNNQLKARKQGEEARIARVKDGKIQLQSGQIVSLNKLCNIVQSKLGYVTNPSLLQGVFERETSSKNDPFTYKIKGVTLTMADMSAIHTHYQLATTAETIMQEYQLDDVNKAFELAKEVRDTMNFNQVSEETAIEDIMAYRHLG